MDPDHNAPPLNPLPPVVWIIALPLIAMEVVLSLGQAGLVGGPQAVGWRIDALQRFAFAPDFLRQMVSLGEYPVDGLMRLVSYPLVHGSITHALFAMVIFLALGKMVGEAMRWWSVVAIWLVASVAGAVVYAAIPATKLALFGAYPPVYGLIGGFTYLLWVRLEGTGAKQYRAFTMIGFLMGAQLLFSVVAGTDWSFVADVSGFVAGFLLSFVVSPGGWARLRGHLRDR